MHSITLYMPLPPSENNAYANKKTGGRCATAKLRGYQNTVAGWALRNHREIVRAREWIAAFPDPKTIRVDAVFVFHHGRVWTKKGTPQKMDASNRLKALHDMIPSMLHLDDDNLIWSGSFEKATCDRMDDQCAIVTISIAQPRAINLRDVLEKIM